MSLEHIRLVEAEQSRQLVAKVKEDLRNALFAAIGQANGETLGKLEPRVHEKLMDGLRMNFNPESDVMGDLFSDAFTDAETLVNEELDLARDDLGLARRRAGYSIAAE